MALEAQQPPVQAAEDEFSQAFSSFAKDDKPPESAAQEGGDNAGGAGEAAAAVGSGDDTGAGATGAGGDAGAEGAASEAAGAEAGSEPAAGAEPAPAAEAAPEPAAASAEPAASTPSADDIVNRLVDLVKESKAEPAPAAAPADELPPLYSAEETEFLQSYEKDWTDVSKAEDLKRRQFGADLVQYVFGQLAPELKRINELAESVANKMHYTEIEKSIGPVDDNLRTQVESWVGKQPTYLQAAYKEVLSKGTVEEVTDLVDRFKKETGTVVKPEPAPSKGGSELSDAAKQAAESLAPVSSRRSGTEQQDDPNDFGAAFAKFAAMKDD